MSPISRRIFVYWVLLLVPTLVVGAGALLLLRREQARIAEQSAYAQEARRTAIAARARLVAENVELLVGDVQAGLLDVLGEAPDSDLEAFLEHWERSNPLVRTAFLATRDGRLQRPAPEAGDEEARGFVRRFGRVLRERPPWSGSAAPPPAVSAAPENRTRDEAEARREIASNVANIQSARRGVQELFKVRDQAIVSQAKSEADAGAAPTLADAASGTRSRAQAERAAGLASGRGTYESKSATQPRASAAPAAAAPPVRDVGPDRRGWSAFVLEGRVHLLAWLQPGGGGDIRGAEIETAALISRLAGVLPAEVGGGEGYALRDAGGYVLHQVGAVSRTAEPLLRVPLASDLLPGWEVVAFLSVGPERGTFTLGFFWVAAVLVAIFVAAILLGGSLLHWQARASAEEAAQKTSFVANVSHEFKTPLTTIRLYAELLEAGRVRDAGQSREYLRTIGRETQRLARLVNNALDFSRLEQGRKKFAREEIDLGAEIGRLLDTHAPRVAEAGLILSRTLPDEPLRVSADRDALEQIVLNLLDNACKYASSGGEVAVTVGRRGPTGAELRVSDRGPGVPPEHRERIFEKFHRVDDALTAEKSGAGLGLSIARQLARGLGGELRYEPRHGGGAEFVLELP